MPHLVMVAVKRTLKTLASGILGGLIVIIIGLVYHIETGADLEIWHTVDLDEEFDRDLHLESFDQYLELEERLFAQLGREIYSAAVPGQGHSVGRYSRRSLSDPGRWPRNWNRSFELSANNPNAAVVLIHGMSDSPYSMRSLAQSFHAAGAYALGMRVPGHGTAPSGLVTVEWQDMAAAARLAVAHARTKAPGRPLVLVGYSNGGALAVHYALEALEDDTLPLPDKLVLLSPEIGITSLAGLAVWEERLGHLLGLKKLAWSSILPEYDPFKYGSFALNAAKQAHLITAAIQSRIAALGKNGSLERFPPILAFQSVADATVKAPVLVSGLLDRLPEGGHELVLFDVNRFAVIGPMLTRDPNAWLESILKDASYDFAVAVVSNETQDTEKVVIRRRAAGTDEIRVAKLDGAAWPSGVYSLSHIALPFAPDDPLYGGEEAGESPGIQLGKMALRGEKGVLVVSGTDMLRLRWNPFHSYVTKRALAIVSTDLDGAAVASD